MSISFLADTDNQTFIWYHLQLKYTSIYTLQINLAIVLYGSVHQHRILSFILFAWRYNHRSSDKDFHVFNYRIFKRSGRANVTLDFKTSG